MFRSADVVVDKVDLLPHLDFDLPLFYRNLQG
jgi:Ni2+-binding GTPase involved in maturation of urease and hydrogenase